MGPSPACSEAILGFPELAVNGVFQPDLKEPGKEFVGGVEEGDWSVVFWVIVGAFAFVDLNNSGYVPCCGSVTCE